ncbi:uncharacterized protein METZ01_LOCUS203403 [marine metagenome]|uniref:Uncharacterized protein n=1 Tax=marine metagenome TaxID=408172 RepID=A0A382EJG5_9ZZZZ
MDQWVYADAPQSVGLNESIETFFYFYSHSSIMPKCPACGHNLNTESKHNWHCDNEDCPNFEREESEDVETCNRCGNDFVVWSGGLWRCDDCGASWA